MDGAGPKNAHMNRDKFEPPNLKTRRTLHRFFELGLLIKGIDGALELFCGLSLLFLSPARINRILMFFVAEELREDPTDLFVSLVLHTARSVIQVRLSASVYLLVHGVVKLLLVGALLTNKLWSYPAAIAVFAAFTAYQLYQLGHHYSLFLVTLTVLNAIVILLITAEYKHAMARNARNLKSDRLN